MLSQWKFFCSLFLIYIAYRAKIKRSLSLDGAIVGWIVGVIHILSGATHIILMALFFYSSTFWTKYKQDIKKKYEEDFQEGNICVPSNFLAFIITQQWDRTYSLGLLFF
jgi:uncharacterized membrane protein